MSLLSTSASLYPVASTDTLKSPALSDEKTGHAYKKSIQFLQTLIKPMDEGSELSLNRLFIHFRYHRGAFGIPFQEVGFY